MYAFNISILSFQGCFITITLEGLEPYLVIKIYSRSTDYIQSPIPKPDPNRQTMPETLREKATKEIKGPGANPSQLGDPISLKAESSEHVPTEEEKGATKTSESSPDPGGIEKNGQNGKSKGDESLREKAVKKLHGPDANPTQLGDPISLKAETTDDIPTDGEEGAHSKRESKL